MKKIDIYTFDNIIVEGKLEHKTLPTYQGYIDLDCETFGEDEAQVCWDICNWCHWSEEKPENLHGDISTCNHGIVFAENFKNRWLALSNGWLNGDEIEISDYVFEHRKEIIWFK